MSNKDFKFDVILNMSDENFTSDLMKAIGAKPGDKINIITPQFERTDGRIISYFPNTKEEYEALKQLSPENLKKIGCQIWDREDGKVHWLFPKEWYSYIPEGTEIVDINGQVEQFVPGETDDEARFGALAYGFIQEETQE